MLAIGIMSGTSLDGVDACLVDIKKSKKNKFEIVHFTYLPYDKELKKKLKEHVMDIEQFMLINTF